MQDILQDSPADITDAAGWTLTDIAALLGDWIVSGFQPTLHFAAQSAGYLLLAGLLGLLVGRPAGAYVEILAVLGFGSLSLSTAMQLTALVGSTAQDCSTYLTAFVPVFGGVAAAGGQTSGALVYSGMFFAMSGFLCAVIRKLLLPVMQIYFCFLSAPVFGATAASPMPLRCLPAACTGCSRSAGHYSALCWGCRIRWPQRWTMLPCGPAKAFYRARSRLWGMPLPPH